MKEGQEVDYTVLLPVVADTLRRNGTRAKYNAFFPLASSPQFIDNAIFTEERSAAGRERAKQQVLEYMRRTADIGQWDENDNLSGPEDDLSPRCSLALQ